MNAKEFTNKLNTVIAEGLDAVNKGQMDPSSLIGALEIQKTQMVMQFVALMAEKHAREMAQRIVPANGLDLKNLKPK